ncbi:ATP-binding protein [Aureisphaera galaxeae]|uniref:ATP-binding protein n=1 Tax=Aureisphaera galaxeae TaxID=1538023 RepID=UPI0023508E6F|nr:ATP-binding protein [Aureisphaera galaxeae]MDC8005372.1 ATP-binding protein [Aureisphaera galaxeae]
MPFQNLKKYILQRFDPEAKETAFSFQNTFSEVLGRETTHEEGLIILLAMAPHVIPGFYDGILKELFPEGGEFPEWGGVKDDTYRSMQATGETLQHIIAQDDMQKRLRLLDYFQEEHWFFKEQLLYIAPVNEGMPFMSGKVIVPPESLHLLMFGEELKPSFGPDFPAKEITTQMDWEDLVLNPMTQEQIHQIRLWIKHKDLLREDWGMAKRMAPGYKALFCGPSGTGKTLTASLLGKEFERPVYRIDLSQVISKYIGETEKNLEKVFIRAENKNWILFFDEADALFGKRSATRSAQDRFANQSVSYLLQRIEYFNGVVILASNYKNNIDQAFIRRFNSIISFAKPNAEERLRLWEMAVPTNISVHREILIQISENYELTGAQINNALSYCCLHVAENGRSDIGMEDFLKAIKVEFNKEEKIFVNL